MEEGCCVVYDETSKTNVARTTRPLVPFRQAPYPLQPYNADNYFHFDEKAVPFQAVVHEEVYAKPTDFSDTPNPYETLKETEFLQKERYLNCSACLSLFQIDKDKTDPSKSSSDICKLECGNYCKALRDSKSDKFVSKRIVVTPPVYRRDPERLVPKIIYQSYFENITKDKYPDMVEFVNTWRIWLGVQILYRRSSHRVLAHTLSG